MLREAMTSLAMAKEASSSVAKWSTIPDVPQ